MTVVCAHGKGPLELAVTDKRVGSDGDGKEEVAVGSWDRLSDCGVWRVSDGVVG